LFFRETRTIDKFLGLSTLEGWCTYFTFLSFWLWFQSEICVDGWVLFVFTQFRLLEL